MKNESANNEGTLTEPAPDVSPSGASENTKAPTIQSAVADILAAGGDRGVLVRNPRPERELAFVLFAIGYRGMAGCSDMLEELIERLPRPPGDAAPVEIGSKEDLGQALRNMEAAGWKCGGSICHLEGRPVLVFLLVGDAVCRELQPRLSERGFHAQIREEAAQPC